MPEIIIHDYFFTNVLLYFFYLVVRLNKDSEKMKLKVFLIIMFIFWFGWILSYLKIDLKINGEKVVKVDNISDYNEQGATGYFFNQKLSVKVTEPLKIKNDYNYYVYYMVRSPMGIVKKKKRTIILKDRVKPTIELKESNFMIIKKGDSFKEPGFKANDDKDKDITNKVKVTGKVDTSKIGTYTLTYTVKDTSNNSTQVSRKVNIIPSVSKYDSSYDKIDNKLRGWGHNNKKDKKRPNADATVEDMAKYNAYYVGPDEKVIYLTFDEGSNDTYVKEIVDVLNKKKVKGTFFFCKNYMLDNKDLVKKIVDSGHIVGNHTSNHKSMPKLANQKDFSKYKEELTSNAEAYKEITGKDMPLLYREPAGEWSYRSLKIVQDMGYRTYFWSAAFLDYAEDLSKNDALNKMKSLYHNGAIYLLHPKNKGNYLALEDFIDYMQKIGFRFETVDKII